MTTGSVRFWFSTRLPEGTLGQESQTGECLGGEFREVLGRFRDIRRQCLVRVHGY
jgi:hypothetical protein